MAFHRDCMDFAEAVKESAAVNRAFRQIGEGCVAHPDQADRTYA
jgi:hypothetical protein